MSDEARKMDAYERVTARIIEALEAGIRPWVQPWAGGVPMGRPLRHNGQGYRGVNVPILWSAAQARGFTNPHWLTYKQAQEYGGNVRKGEKAEQIVFFKPMEKLAPDPVTGELKKMRWGIARLYSVFNAEQCEGLKPARLNPQPAPDNEAGERIAPIESAAAYFAAIGASIRHGGGMAYWHPTTDVIHMPELHTFTDAEAYYSTLGHEHVHWSGHASRLDRAYLKDYAMNRASRANEELVAEMGAAFLMADLGLCAEPRADHADYIGSWLKALNDDKRAIFRAAGFAEKAVTLLHTKAGRVTELEPELTEAA